MTCGKGEKGGSGDKLKRIGYPRWTDVLRTKNREDRFTRCRYGSDQAN